MKCSSNCTGHRHEESFSKKNLLPCISSPRISQVLNTSGEGQVTAANAPELPTTAVQDNTLYIRLQSKWNTGVNFSQRLVQAEVTRVASDSMLSRCNS